MTDIVKRTDDNGIATLTISRPKARNAMNAEARAGLRQRLEEVRDDDSVDVVIITGDGDSFVAGADINELAVRKAGAGLDGEMQKLFDVLSNFDKPTVAAVGGYALGGGLELALACDIRVGSTNALFGLPETGLGIIPGAGGTHRLARIVGTGMATDIIITGRKLSGEEALNTGLITYLVEPDELAATATKVAQRIQRKGPLAVRLAREILSKGPLDHATAMSFERVAQALLYSSPERDEGTSAFLNKRHADFSGVRYDRN